MNNNNKNTNLKVKTLRMNPISADVTRTIIINFKQLRGWLVLFCSTSYPSSLLLGPQRSRAKGTLQLNVFLCKRIKPVGFNRKSDFIQDIIKLHLNVLITIWNQKLYDNRIMTLSRHVFWRINCFISLCLPTCCKYLSFLDDFS